MARIAGVSPGSRHIELGGLTCQLAAVEGESFCGHWHHWRRLTTRRFAEKARENAYLVRLKEPSSRHNVVEANEFMSPQESVRNCLTKHLLSMLRLVRLRSWLILLLNSDANLIDLCSSSSCHSLQSDQYQCGLRRICRLSTIRSGLHNKGSDQPSISIETILSSDWDGSWGF